MRGVSYNEELGVPFPTLKRDCEHIQETLSLDEQGDTTYAPIIHPGARQKSLCSVTQGLLLKHLLSRADAPHQIQPQTWAYCHMQNCTERAPHSAVSADSTERVQEKKTPGDWEGLFLHPSPLGLAAVCRFLSACCPAHCRRKQPLWPPPVTKLQQLTALLPSQAAGGGA